MDKTNFFSVHSLINSLCEKLISENNPSECVNLADVRKLRVKSFEILLKKSKYNTNPKNYIDPIRELDIIQFATRIKAKNDYRKLKNIEKFEEILNDISKSPYFLNGHGKAVLAFLLFVRDSLLEYNQCENELSISLLVPGPFTLHSEYTRSLSYPFEENKYCLGKLEHFKSLTTILDYNNPYLPRFLFEKLKTDSLAEVKPFKLYLEKQNHPKSISYRYLKSVTSLLKCKPLENVENNEVDDVNKKEDTVVFPQSGNTKRFGWNWENLGTTSVVTENKFCSELGASIPLAYLINEKLDVPFEAKVVNVQSFLVDVKSVLVGIESESFFLDESITFHMVKNITIPGVIPNVMKNFVHECLECGTSFRRLQIMTLKKNFKLMFDGFIFKALCCAIEDYLIMFRQFVFSYNDTKLLEFYERMKNSMKQISGLAYILTIHPKVNANVKPPMGSQFLGYIYKEIMRITQPDMLSLLVFILKRCCHVYFKYIQKWIFLGHLDDPSNELFICFVDYYHPNTKYYFDKAYFIRKEFVPGFFQGYEDYILQCGKYTMLLKAFNPNHPIFSIDYPPISVCLSFGELKEIEESCEEYLKKALEVCNAPVTVQDIYNRNIEKKANFFKLVHDKSQKVLENWSMEKAQLYSLEFAKKRMRFEEISAQIEEKRFLQNKEKMKNIVLERELNKKQDKLEQDVFQLEQQQTLKSIAHLEELNILLEKQVNKHSDIEEKINPSVSTIDSEFESCGEDEIETEYKDCNIQYQINSKLASKNNEKDNLIDTVNSNEIEADKEKIDTGLSLRLKTDIENKNLTEAQRNKLKVLDTEYNAFYTNFKDVNFNTLDNKIGTDIPEITTLQRNRIKIMQNNPFEPVETIPRQTAFDVTTERGRNRKKMMDSEFQLFTETSTKVACTPMSTSSDSCLEEDISETENVKYSNIAEENVESVNTNDISINSKSNCNVAESKELSEVQELSELDEINCNNLSLSLHNIEEERNGNTSDDIYKRCEDLIKNNFKCKPITGLIQLKDISSEPFESHNDKRIKEILNKQCNLNSLSVITLTEFLQKSVILPLRAHLQIVNNEVMRVFLLNLDIIGHFNSLRNYFFLMDGEFSSIICDELISKLEGGATPSELFNYQTLHSILDKAIGSSSCGSDKNSDKLSFIVTDLPEKFDLTSPSVLLNLCLSYRVAWPTNLILSPEALDKYGDIFKYLFKVRRISWVLEQSFRILKESAKFFGSELIMSPQYRRVQLIRHKFFHFVQALRNHITASALQGSWKEFEDDLLKAKCIEEIYRKHTTYIKKILFLCMLNKSSADFYKTIENIFKVSLRFYRNLKSREWKKSNDNFYTHPRFEKLLTDEMEFEKLVKYVIYLGNKIVKRGYQEEIGELINLINYNQYYVVCI